MSVRDDPVLFLRGGKSSSAGGAAVGGGSAVTTTRPHKLDAAEHQAADDTTRLDATVDRHGLLPKLSGDASDALLGDGTWGAPLGGTPASTVTDETSWGITPAVGSDTEYARQDHTHGTPANPGTGGGTATGGELMISDTPSTPLVFGDLLQNEAQDDFVYAT